MDWHDYITGRLVETRLAERRAAAALERLVRTHRAPRPPFRIAIGTALIRLGSKLGGAVPITVHDSGH